MGKIAASPTVNETGRIALSQGEKTPKVSICIMSYNHGQYINDCLASVIGQQVDANLEILVGDDCSTDQTRQIISEYAERYPGLVFPVFHDKNIGASNNYQHLISKATGDYIAHLDGDDYWLPGKLAAQVRFLEVNTNCTAAYTNAFCIRDDGTPAGVFNNAQPARFDISALLRRGNFINHSSGLYRSTLKYELLGMQAPFLDYRILLRLARHGDVGYLNQALTAYRVASRTSIIIHANELVRALYWEALQDVPRDLVSPQDLGHGMAEFMRSIFFRAIRTRTWTLIETWWPRVLAEAPVGRARILAWASWAILRTGFVEGMDMLCRRITNNPMKVLYRR